MLRIATFNINGIRATQRRGFEGWLAERDCDVVALQEVRCPVAALPEGVFGGYHLTYDAGQLAGRNGVAVLTRERPLAARSWGAGVLTRAPGDGHVELAEHEEPGRLARELRAFADEGRYLEVDLADVPLTVASLYLPKGGLPAHLQDARRRRESPQQAGGAGTEGERQAAPGARRARQVEDGGAKFARKMTFLQGFARHLTAARRGAAAQGREFLLMGDLNIAHTPQDVNNWRRQVTSEGFLPEERAWLDEVIGPRRLVDVLRRHHPDAQGPYSWWSWMGQAFAKDTGWRIDYHLATPALARSSTRAWVDREASREERMSDHAPVVVEYAYPR